MEFSQSSASSAHAALGVVTAETPCEDAPAEIGRGISVKIETRSTNGAAAISDNGPPCGGPDRAGAVLGGGL